MLDVTALGELLVDFAPVESGGDADPVLAARPGGAPGNYLAALSKYGARTALLAKVGEDAFGARLIDTLAAAGVETRGILRDPDAFTTLAFVTLREGERTFSFARKPGADTRLRFEELDLGLIDQARCFHFGSLSLTDEPAGSATRQAVDYAKSKGKCITFDPNYRPPLWPSPARARAEITWGLEQADVVKISDEELSFLWDCGPEAGARRLLEEFGASLVMVTLGPKGCYLKSGQGACLVPAPRVHPVDTTGAGDIFFGAAMSRLLPLDTPFQALDSDQLEAAARFAVTAASLSTQRPGGIPSIPSEAEVQAALG